MAAISQNSVWCSQGHFLWERQRANEVTDVRGSVGYRLGKFKDLADICLSQTPSHSGEGATAPLLSGYTTKDG